jgi:hypothetical protein
MSTIEYCSHLNCKRKLKITAFPCRCGKKFCDKHRVAEDHKCTFDFKEDFKKVLNKTMGAPLTGDKLGGHHI